MKKSIHTSLSLVVTIGGMLVLSAILSYWSRTASPLPEPVRTGTALGAFSPTTIPAAKKTVTPSPSATLAPPTRTPSVTPFPENSPLKPILVDTVEFSPFPAIDRSPDGKIIGLMTHRGDTHRFQWFDAQTMQELGSFEVNDRYYFNPGVTFSPDHSKAILEGFDDGGNYILDLTPGLSNDQRIIKFADYYNERNYVFSHDSSFIAFINHIPGAISDDSFSLYSFDGTSFAEYDHTGFDDSPFRYEMSLSLNDIAISPDDRWILVGASNGVATLWNNQTGEVKNFIHSSSVRAVAFSPDGQYVVTGCSDSLVRFWAISSGELKRTINGFSDKISSLEFSKDDGYLMVGTGNNSDRVVNLNTGKVTIRKAQPVSVEPFYMTTMMSELYGGYPQVSPDGRYLYTYGNDIQVWDIPAGKVDRLLINPYAHQDNQRYKRISEAKLSPDGKYLAVFISGGPFLYIQSTETGDILADFDISKADFLDFEFILSPDSRFLAYPEDNRIEIFSTLDGSLYNLINLPDIASNFIFSFSLDSEKIFTVNKKHSQYWTWDVSTAMQLSSDRFPILDWIADIQYPLLISAGSLIDTSLILDHSYTAYTVDYSSYGSSKGTQVFNLEKNELVNLERLPQSTNLKPFYVDGNVMVSFLPDPYLEGSFVFWRLDTGSVIYEVKNVKVPDSLYLTNGYLIIRRTTNKEIWDVRAIMEAAGTAVSPTTSLLPTPTSLPSTQTEVGQPVFVSLENIPQAVELACFGAGVVNEARWAADGQVLWVSSSLGVDQLTPDLQLSSRVATDGQVTGSALAEDGSLLIAEMIDNHAVVKRTGDNETLLDLAGYQYPVLSPDGKLAAFLEPSGGTSSSELEVWDLGKSRLVSALDIGFISSLDEQDITARFSQDGKYIAAILQGGDLRIWNVADGGIVNAPGVINQPAQQFAFSPDGKYVALVTQGSAWVYPVQPGEDPIEFHFFDSTKESQFPRLEYVNEVTAAALSPDNRIIAVGTTLHEVTLFDRASQSEIRKITGIPSTPVQILFSPDRETLLVLDRDGDLLTWDIASGELLNTNQDHTAAIAGLFFNAQGELQAWENNSAWVLQSQASKAQQVFTIPQGTITAFSPNKQWLAVYEPYSVSIWDAPSGQISQVLKEEFKPVYIDPGYKERRALNGAAFSPDSQYFAMVGTGDIWLYDTSDWQMKREINTDYEFRQPVYGPISDMLYVLLDSGYDKNLNIFALKKKDDPQALEDSYLDQIILSPDEKMIAGLSYSENHLGNYIIKDVHSGEITAEYLFYNDFYPTISAFSPDGRLVAIGQEDGTIYLLNLDTDEVDMEFVGHRGAVTHLAFSPDGLTLASGGADGTIRFWDVGN